MNIEEIEKQWSVDSEIDLNDLAYESNKSAKLHSKYYAYYRTFAQEYNKTKTNKARLVKLKTEYYLGDLDKDTLDKYHWKPFQKRILKTDLATYLAADDDMIQVELKLADLNYAVEYLESIIKQIANRGHHVRNVLEFLKFKNGGY
ncbi:recombination repair and ssDNA binding protein [Rhizobium phage RHph_I1_18]|nr:recombination repair and ssDNA binding protein [Rhizobium phage RHph_I1_18]